MNRDDIIRMAREAGLAFDSEEYPDIWQTYMYVGREEIERFVKLVEKSIYQKNMFAEAYAYGYAEGTADERKACAKLCEIEADEHGTDTNEWYVARACAVLIHSRDE